MIGRRNENRQEAKTNGMHRRMMSNSERSEETSEDGSVDSDEDSESSFDSEDMEEDISKLEEMKRRVLAWMGRPVEFDTEVDLSKLGTVEVFRQEYAHHLDWFGYEEIKQATALGKKFGMSRKQMDSFFRSFYKLDNTRRGDVGVKQLCLHLSLPRTPFMDWVLGYAPHKIRKRLTVMQLLLRVFLFCTMTIEEVLDYQIELLYIVKGKPKLTLEEIVKELLTLNYGLVHGEQASLSHFILTSQYFSTEREEVGDGAPMTSAEGRRVMMRCLLYFPVLVYPSIQAHRQLSRRFLSARDWKELRPRRLELKLNSFFTDYELEDNAPPSFYDEKTGTRSRVMTPLSTRRRQPSFDFRLNEAFDNIAQSPFRAVDRTPHAAQEGFFSTSRPPSVKNSPLPPSHRKKSHFDPRDGDPGPPPVLEVKADKSPTASNGLTPLEIDVEDPALKPSTPPVPMKKQTSVFDMFSKKKAPDAVSVSEVFGLLENGTNAWTISATSVLCLVCIPGFAKAFGEEAWQKFKAYYIFTLEVLPSDQALMGLRAGYVRPQNLRNMGYSLYTVSDIRSHPLFASGNRVQNKLLVSNTINPMQLECSSSDALLKHQEKALVCSSGSTGSKGSKGSKGKRHKQLSEKQLAQSLVPILRVDGYGDKFIDFVLLVSGFLRDEEHMYRLFQVIKEREEPADIPFWQEFDDDLHEREFFYNMRTGEARWDIPEALRLWRLEQEKNKHLHVHIW